MMTSHLGGEGIYPKEGRLLDTQTTGFVEVIPIQTLFHVALLAPLWASGALSKR